MSLGAGGLAQMTYNNNTNFTSAGHLGVPGSGFASRGKGAHIKRLSVAPPPNINSIYEDDVDANPAPRTSRSHLLAGLRTAPKNSHSVPASAPYNQTQHRFEQDANWSATRGNGRLGNDAAAAARTSTASHFPNMGNMPTQYSNQSVGQQMYCMPEQVLAPPALNLDDIDYNDQQTYESLVATNYFLAQRQQELQRKLLDVTTAAQQVQGLHFNNSNNNNSNNGAVANNLAFTNHHVSVYNQQLQNGMQPVVQPVPNQPGVWAVYNPMTGGCSFITEPAAHQPNQRSISPPYSASSPDGNAPGLYRKHSTPSPPTVASINRTRTITPPKSSPSPPQDVTPLPPPSANAFRPGHRKSVSSAFSAGNIKVNGTLNNTTGEDGTNVPRSAAFPPTPLTGSFGPGMGRAGEHPLRQPRGPPPLEELVAKPTSKDEGSQNFATRQRRRAVHNLVKAGNQRRCGRSN